MPVFSLENPIESKEVTEEWTTALREYKEFVGEVNQLRAEIDDHYYKKLDKLNPLYQKALELKEKLSESCPHPRDEITYSDSEYPGSYYDRSRTTRTWKCNICGHHITSVIYIGEYD